MCVFGILYIYVFLCGKLQQQTIYGFVIATSRHTHKKAAIKTKFIFMFMYVNLKMCTIWQNRSKSIKFFVWVTWVEWCSFDVIMFPCSLFCCYVTVTVTIAVLFSFFFLHLFYSYFFVLCSRAQCTHTQKHVSLHLKDMRVSNLNIAIMAIDSGERSAVKLDFVMVGRGVYFV